MYSQMAGQPSTDSCGTRTLDVPVPEGWMQYSGETRGEKKSKARKFGGLVDSLAALAANRIAHGLALGAGNSSSSQCSESCRLL
jgi:hypothetical protein